MVCMQQNQVFSPLRPIFDLVQNVKTVFGLLSFIIRNSMIESKNIDCKNKSCHTPTIISGILNWFKQKFTINITGFLAMNN